MSEGQALSSCGLIETVFAPESVEVNSSCALHAVLPMKVLLKVLVNLVG